MSHAHGNTLASRLDVRDLDRFTREHDYICQYIEAHAEEFVRRVTGETPGVCYRHAQTEMEYLLSGERGFKVGFVDLLIRVEESFRYFRYPRDVGWNGIERDRLVAELVEIRECEGPPEVVWISDSWHLPRILVEVKSSVSSIGEVIRQLRLYRQTLEKMQGERKKVLRSVLVTPQRLHAAAVNSLRNADIEYIQIGERFETWKAEQGLT